MKNGPTELSEALADTRHAARMLESAIEATSQGAPVTAKYALERAAIALQKAQAVASKGGAA